MALAMGRRRLNACHNAVDRHLHTHPNKVAIIWAGSEPGHYERITWRELKHQVARVANVLEAHGVQEGDRVCIYMPMTPAVAYTMLACARIGAVHSVVFAGFSAESLRDRILDSGARLKAVPLKHIVDQALEALTQVVEGSRACHTPRGSARFRALVGVSTDG